MLGVTPPFRGGRVWQNSCLPYRTSKIKLRGPNIFFVRSSREHANTSLICVVCASGLVRFCTLHPQEGDTKISEQYFVHDVSSWVNILCQSIWKVAVSTSILASYQNLPSGTEEEPGHLNQNSRYKHLVLLHSERVEDMYFYLAQLMGVISALKVSWNIFQWKLFYILCM